MPIVFYSILILIISAVASLVLFFRIQRNHILSVKFFFWHYAFGFFLLGLVHLLVFFVNLGVQVSYNALIALYILSFFGLLFSYLLFYRGTVLLFTKNKILTDMFPFIVFPLFAALALFSFFIINIESSIMFTAIMWGFLFPVNAFLCSLFFYFFIKGATFDAMKKRPCAIILSIAWLFVLILDVTFWLNVGIYPSPEFWIVKVASMKWWLLARAMAYLLILIGSLLYGRHLRHLQIDEKP